jgi:hypothetical protein
MKKKIIATYLGILGVMMFLLAVLPFQHAITPTDRLLVFVSALLFTLLVWLSTRLIGTGQKVESVVFTALFILFFYPDITNFLSCDLEAVISLSSQCIVPFFIGQYNRVSQRNFQRIYVLMLLMGIFCSYTHDGITIPLCAGFLWLSFLNRDRFFRTACWPMVIGFVIGTGLSIWKAHRTGVSSVPSNLAGTISQTSTALQILWNAKVFLLSVGLTAWLSVSRWGRQMLLANFREHTLLACCAMFSYCTLPFAPLGLENAVAGVCFFCMFWVLILVKSLTDKFYYGREQL